jgi:hypothetical protein
VAKESVKLLKLKIAIFETLRMAGRLKLARRLAGTKFGRRLQAWMGPMMPPSQNPQRNDSEAALPLEFITGRFSEESQSLLSLGWDVDIDSSKPNVVAVLDTFSTSCFSAHVNLIQPRPDNWLGMARRYGLDFILVESAWHGNDSSWQYRVGNYSIKPGDEIREMTLWAKKEGIPTVFWNKEDPVHFSKFIKTASYFDHIFTTDANRVSDYRSQTKAKSVNSLPFAAEPNLHNPRGIEGRNDRFCFAGSWYGERYPKRAGELANVLRPAQQYGLDIFDRNLDRGIFPFPQEFITSVKGSLPYDELCKKYGDYRAFLNVNSVTDSPTMFSRRVFELLASGTPVVSTPARGIPEVLGQGRVWTVESQEDATEALHVLSTNSAEWERRSLLGVRTVYREHLYEDRLKKIAEQIGRPDLFDANVRSILLFAVVEDESGFAEIHDDFIYQTNKNYDLMVWVREKAILIKQGVRDPAFISNYSSPLDAIKNLTQYSAFGLVGRAYKYGPDYVQDLRNATRMQPSARGWLVNSGRNSYQFTDKGDLYSGIFEANIFLSLFTENGFTGSVSKDVIFSVYSDQKSPRLS